MEALRAILMGLLQGVTEFLPVSSSGHLAVAEILFGEGGFEAQDLIFDVMLHVGTLAAVFVYCRSEIGGLLRALFRLGRPAADEREARERRLLAAVALSTVPTAVLGFAVKLTLAGFFSQLIFVGTMLLVTSLVLYLSRFCKGDRAEVSPWASLVVGTIQGVAALPGISRSGMTIVGGMALGVEREAAAKFSFLISIPAISGAALISFLEMSNLPNFNTGLIFSLFCGTIAAAFAGYISLILLISIVRRAKLNMFAYYCATVGVIVVILGCIR